MSAPKSILAKDKVKASRLLGRQANIPLKNLGKFAQLFKTCRQKSRQNHHEHAAKIIRGKKKVRKKFVPKTQEDVEEDMDHTVASLLSLLLGIRNLVFWMGK